MFAPSALNPSPGGSSCERDRIKNNLGPTATVRFVDYLVGRLSGRYQPGDPSLHRRKIWNKKSQINDTYFMEGSIRIKNAKIFPSGITIMPDMKTKEYSQNIMKGGSRFSETRYTSAAESVPADNVKKMDGSRDGIEFCTRETSAVYQKDSSSNMI